MSKASGRADAYARWARSGGDVSFERTLATLLELLPPPPLRVLDIGCGEGRVGSELIERGYEVVGVDSDPRMVELACDNHPAFLADAATLPFADAAFSCVISVHALMEVDALQSAATEMARVLQEGSVGVAIVEHPFASGAKVTSYSEESRYSWDVKHDDIDLQLGGIHRPLETYVRTFEDAGLNLNTLREISVGPWDPMSLAIRVTRVSD